MISAAQPKDYRLPCPGLDSNLRSNKMRCDREFSTQLTIRNPMIDP